MANLGVTISSLDTEGAVTELTEGRVGWGLERWWGVKVG